MRRFGTLLSAFSSSVIAQRFGSVRRSAPLEQSEFTLQTSLWRLRNKFLKWNYKSGRKPLIELVDLWINNQLTRSIPSPITKLRNSSLSIQMLPKVSMSSNSCSNFKACEWKWWNLFFFLLFAEFTWTWLGRNSNRMMSRLLKYIREWRDWITQW